MVKRCFAFLLILVIMSGVALTESKDTKHDKDIEEVLFGSMGVPTNKDAFILMQWAAYFAMDCIGKENLEEQKYLDKLRKYGVPDVPEKVSDFHYIGNKFENQHHERCTHMGWSDELYGKDMQEDIARWVTIRKELMINTFTRVLTAGEKKWWETVDVLNIFSADVDQPVQRQCESLAAIVYYTHILGDHCYNTRTTMPDRIPLVREHEGDRNPDILYDLKKYLAILFPSQTSTSNYLSLIGEIDNTRKQWLENVGTYNITTDEQYEAYQAQAKRILDALKRYVPLLLKEEDFFAKVFYSTH